MKVGPIEVGRGQGTSKYIVRSRITMGVGLESQGIWSKRQGLGWTARPGDLRLVIYWKNVPGLEALEKMIMLIGRLCS
jgi:hypothetical protein